MSYSILHKISRFLFVCSVLLSCNNNSNNTSTDKKNNPIPNKEDAKNQIDSNNKKLGLWLEELSNVEFLIGPHQIVNNLSYASEAEKNKDLNGFYRLVEYENDMAKGVSYDFYSSGKIYRIGEMISRKEAIPEILIDSTSSNFTFADDDLSNNQKDFLIGKWRNFAGFKGKQVYFYESGDTMFICHYDEYGSRQGISKFFNKKGQVEREEICNNGVCEVIEYYDNGQRKNDYLSKGDNKYVEIEYYESGKVKSETLIGEAFGNNLWMGKYQESSYFENGQVSEVLNYGDNTYKVFDGQGNIIEYGRLEGPVKIKSSDQNVSSFTSIDQKQNNSNESACSIMEIQSVNGYDHVVKTRGAKRKQCYIDSDIIILGYGDDFVLGHWKLKDHYITYDCNCKTITYESGSNMKVLGVEGNKIKTDQLNGIYYYNKYWKTVHD